MRYYITIKTSSRLLMVLFLLLTTSLPLYADDSYTLMVFPRRDAATTIKLFTPLAEYLSTKTSKKFQLRTAANFKAFVSAIKNGDIDLVHMNQFHYINAHRDYGYEIIAQSEEFGEKDIAGAIYVRRDSGISQLNQLKGKDIIFGGGKTAMMSYIVPTYLLQEAGLNAVDYQQKIAVSPPNAVIALFLGHADAAGAGELVSELPVVKKKINNKELKIIARSLRLPHLAWAVSEKMPTKDKKMLKDLLINLKNTDQGQTVLSSARITGFNQAVDEDYDKHRDIAKSVFDLTY